MLQASFFVAAVSCRPRPSAVRPVVLIVQLNASPNRPVAREARRKLASAACGQPTRPEMLRLISF